MSHPKSYSEFYLIKQDGWKFQLLRSTLFFPQQNISWTTRQIFEKLVGTSHRMSHWLTAVFVQVAREAYFDGQSLLDAGVTNVSNLRSSFYISFSFRTEKDEGLMFNHISQVRRVSEIFVSILFLPWLQLLLSSCLFYRETPWRCFWARAALWWELAAMKLRLRRHTTTTIVIILLYTTTLTGKSVRFGG